MTVEKHTILPPAKKRTWLPEAERRARRVARGLPPQTAARIAAKHRFETKRSKPRSKARYDHARALINGIKLERGCADCGYRAHPAALQFDHLPGTKKELTIGQSTASSNIARILAEVAKCEVVCANCHAVREADRRAARKQAEGGAE